MLITEPIEILLPTFVVGLTFCTHGDPTKYTITEIIEGDDDSCEFVVLDDCWNYREVQIECEYLYIDDMEYCFNDIPYEISFPCSSRDLSRSLIDVKKYVSKLDRNKIKVCK